MHTANYILRRVFAWPLLIVGMTLVQFGGVLIRTGAWCVDVDTSDIDTSGLD